MASGVEELLGMLYEMIEDGKPVPMHAEQCKIDRDRALDLLDEIKAQFPEEFGQAQKIVNAREEYVSNARQEVERLRTQAQEQCKRMISETEIVRQAKDVANSMVRKAQEQSAQLRQAANGYCAEALSRTDAAISEAAAQLRQAQSQFQQLVGQSGGSYLPDSDN